MIPLSTRREPRLDPLPAEGAAPAPARPGVGVGPAARTGVAHARDDGAGSAFDVCHVGVVLRAVLLVQAIVAVGVLYGATTLVDGLALFGRGSIVSMWAVLSWLVVSCALQRPLSRLQPRTQWFAAIGLGVLCALGGWSLLRVLGLGEGLPAWWLPPAASGAAIATALFAWLRLRERARLPADTTARLAELQSRIRPHFLFNTLNTAVTLVRADPATAEAVLEDLAELFRVALSEPGQSVTLGEEVELARRYLAIEQVRFGERLRIEWSLDGRADPVRVPRLLLQPLVENAVRHGVEPSDDGGLIRVRTRVQRDQVIVEIHNTLGSAPSQPGHGIALANVRERLRLMHDVAAELDTARDEQGFRVRLVLPLG